MLMRPKVLLRLSSTLPLPKQLRAGTGMGDVRNQRSNINVFKENNKNMPKLQMAYLPSWRLQLNDLQMFDEILFCVWELVG